MNNNKRGLGRGLEALFSVFDQENEEESVKELVEEEKEGATKPKTEKIKKQASATANNSVNEIDINLISPNANQPRKNFDENALNELADSIKMHGVIQPIVVNNNGDGTYLIIAGERRYRASKIAGLETIPAVVKNYTPKQIKEISIIENLQREDLNPIEAARAIKQLMEEYKWTQEVVAERIGKSRPVIANYLRLLSLTPEVLSMIEDGSLSAGHARCLVVITDPRDQYKMALTAKNNRISVRELEKAVKNLLNPKTKGGNATVEQSPELKELINEMQRVFATKVSAIGNDRKGRIYIDYYSRDDLDRICQLLELVNKKTLTLKDLNNFNKTSKK